MNMKMKRDVTKILHPTLGECLREFWVVSRCWHDPKRAVREGMTVERAIAILRWVRTHTWGREGGMGMAMKSHNMLNEIVCSQCEVVVEEDVIVGTDLSLSPTHHQKPS